jgi:hypothetical protein
MRFELFKADLNLASKNDFPDRFGQRAGLSGIMGITNIYREIGILLSL